MEAIQVKNSQYERWYMPCGGFVLIAKDPMPEVTVGKILLTEKIKEDHSRFTCTGTVVAKSPFKRFEDEHEEYVFNRIKKGDRVGFGATVPLRAPSPPHYQFEDKDKDVYLTLHVKDILCVMCESEDKLIEYVERFKE